MLDIHRDSTISAFDGKHVYGRVGVKLDRPVPAREALALAGADFKVEKRPLWTTTGDRETLRAVPGKFAITRVDNDVPLGVVGRAYKPIQYADFLDTFDAAIGEGLVEPVTVGILGNGERAFLCLRIVGDPIVVAGVDLTERYLVATGSHDGTGCNQLLFTAHRIWCFNTINCAVREATKAGRIVGIRHSGNVAEKLEAAVKAIGIARQAFDDYATKAQALARVQLTEDKALAYVKAVLPDAAEDATDKVKANVADRQQAILDLWRYSPANTHTRIRGSLWAAFNAVTEYVDHVTGRKRSAESNLRSAVWGTGAALKQHALTVALSNVN